MRDLEEAAEALEKAEEEYFSQEAIAEICARGGLRWAWTNLERTTAAVACNGDLIGQITPARASQLLNGWRAYTSLGTQLEGTFHTAREAAAQLAREMGVQPNVS